jgi:hypothetical protein
MLLLHGHPRTSSTWHRAGRRIASRVLMLWSDDDDLEDLYGDPLAILRTWADDVSGHTIASGHHIAEQAPRPSPPPPPSGTLSGLPPLSRPPSSGRKCPVDRAHMSGRLGAKVRSTGPEKRALAG